MLQLVSNIVVANRSRNVPGVPEPCPAGILKAYPARLFFDLCLQKSPPSKYFTRCKKLCNPGLR
jgi:hypothetical protein